MEQQRRLDPCRERRIRGGAEEGDRGRRPLARRPLARLHRGAIDQRAAPAEADDADLAGRAGRRGEPADRRDRVLHRLREIERGDHGARAVVVAERRPARRGEEIGRQRREARNRQPPRNVARIGLEPPILVDHHHRRMRSFALGRVR